MSGVAFISESNLDVSERLCNAQGEKPVVVPSGTRVNPLRLIFILLLFALLFAKLYGATMNVKLSVISRENEESRPAHMFQSCSLNTMLLSRVTATPADGIVWL